MLEFFRKNQRVFFIFVTAIISVTFIFFGTFQTTPRDTRGSEVVFTAVDGQEWSRKELQEMTSFLSTDEEDQEAWGIVWGPNFLNDGVIKKDFLESGLAQMLVESYAESLTEDFNKRLEKEQKFKPYVHPDANFLSAKTVWSYFAPDLKEAFEAFQLASKEEKFPARVRLFLEEKRFPSSLLRRVLQLQEQQYDWVVRDPRLNHEELSLFSYRTVEDWFGRRFQELMSQFIINAASLAEEKGYVVSSEEALSDLVRNSSLSFEKFKSHPQIGVTTSRDYFSEQLRRLSLDQSTAVRLWQRVMLFRRLFNDVGNSIFLDAFSYQQFQNYAKERAVVDLYQLPESLRFSSYKELQKFETYLDVVAPKLRKGKMILGLPGDFLEASDLERVYPELVSRRYLLRVALVDKESLQVKVGLKETWDWETEEVNWERLKKHFPDLSLRTVESKEERFSILEQLDVVSRERVDRFARSLIVDTHPEWLEEALDKAQTQVWPLNLRSRGGKVPFEGVVDQKKLMDLLDLATNSESADAVRAAEELMRFSADGTHFYRIVILDRDEYKHVSSFEEANSDGVLDSLLEQRLQEHYDKMRQEKLSEVFVGEKGKIRPFEEVKVHVADDLFSSVLTSIYQDSLQQLSTEGKSVEKSGNFCAPRRFYYFMRAMQQLIEKEPQKAYSFIAEAQKPSSEGVLPPIVALQDQWKLLKKEVRVKRKSQDLLDSVAAFGLARDAWSVVSIPDNGDVHFFQSKGYVVEEAQVADKVTVGQKALSDDARRYLMEELLAVIKDKKAISLTSQKMEE